MEQFIATSFAPLRQTLKQRQTVNAGAHGNGDQPRQNFNTLFYTDTKYMTPGDCMAKEKKLSYAEVLHLIRGRKILHISQIEPHHRKEIETALIIGKFPQHFIDRLAFIGFDVTVKSA